MEKKFDFKPMQWVLVRDKKSYKWALAQYSHYNKDKLYKHRMLLDVGFQYCIPYKGNEHLLGTTDDYVEPYEPKDGDFVVCEKKGEGPKSIFIFKGWNEDRIIMYCIFFYSELKPIVGLDERGFNSDEGFLRKATDSETSDFLSKLHEIGKDWNPEKKCIEDVWTPKDGDFVYLEYNGGDKYLLISKGGLDYYASYDYRDSEVKFDRSKLTKDCVVKRITTDTEKQQLLDALHKEGKDWDAEKKEIVEYKWMPVFQDTYYYVNSWLEADSDAWTGHINDTRRQKNSNCFRTKEEAQAMAEKFKQLLKGE